MRLWSGNFEVVCLVLLTWWRWQRLHTLETVCDECDSALRSGNAVAIVSAVNSVAPLCGSHASEVVIVDTDAVVSYTVGLSVVQLGSVSGGL